MSAPHSAAGENTVGSPAGQHAHDTGVNRKGEAEGPPVAASSRRVADAWYRRLLPVGVGLLAAVFWEVATRTGGTFATPPLLEILAAFVLLPFEPGFWSAMATTLQALVIGYALAVALGVPVGIVVGRIVPLERVVSVYLTLMLSVPLAAIVPVIIILFGIGLSARVAVVVLFTLPMLTANVITGVANVDRSLLEMGTSYGCSRIQLARRIIVPAAMPEIFAGLRLGAGRAVIGMVVGELIIIAAGIGGLIGMYSAAYRMDFTYAVVLSILLISALFVNAVRLLEARVLHWQRDRQE